MSEQKEKFILKGLWILTILVCIKSIFTDFGADSGYQVAMSYRHLQGDMMLKQMWEPHQTSIFLNDLLMGLYHLIVPSYAGVVLFLQVVGTALFGLLGWFVYRTIRNVTGNFTGQAIWMFFMVFRAKQTPFPEFANLEIGFSILIFCLLLRFYKAQEKWHLPVLMGLCAFLQALSYPSCVIGAAAVVLLFFLKTEKKWKNTLLFLGTAGVLGLIYLGYFFVRLGGEIFVTAIRNIFLSDTHSTFKFGGYWTGFLLLTGAVLGSIALAALLKLLVKEKLPFSVGTLSAGVFFIVELGMLALQRRLGVDWNCSIYVLPVILLLLAAAGYKKASKGEKEIWLTGVLLSLASFLATLLLTDLGMITITAYLVLGGAVSLLLFKHLFKDDKIVIMMVLLIILAHRGLVVWGIGNTNDRVRTIWEVQNFIRSGPAAGVVCDHVTKAQALWTLEDFAAYLQPEDKILVVGEELIDPMVYLYANCEISNYSTIDTPKYNECLEEYFRLNPQKEPTVVAVSSWFGTPNVPDDTYVMKWVNERCELWTDARYFRLYRRK